MTLITTRSTNDGTDGTAVLSKAANNYAKVSEGEDMFEYSIEAFEWITNFSSNIQYI